MFGKNLILFSMNKFIKDFQSSVKSEESNRQII